MTWTTSAQSLTLVNGSESLMAIVMMGTPGSTSMLKLNVDGVTAPLAST